VSTPEPIGPEAFARGVAEDSPCDTTRGMRNDPCCYWCGADVQYLDAPGRVYWADCDWVRLRAHFGMPFPATLRDGEHTYVGTENM